ncbi:MAG: hypothetical protein H6832_14670 [Planctomycetes bacterium]|nr:hypothetical protein [Planctomycetota bacterium]
MKGAHRTFPATAEVAPVVNAEGILSTAEGRCAVTMDRAVFSKILERAAARAGSRTVAIRAGRVCGKAFAEELDAAVQAHYDIPLRDVPLVQFREILARACLRHGFARVALDTTHLDDGLIEIVFDCEVVGAGDRTEDKDCDDSRDGIELAFQSGVIITILEQLAGDASLDGVLVEGSGGRTSCLVTSRERLTNLDGGTRPIRSEILATLRMAEEVMP